jgi:GMP synthase (glutamine-hydrolysing)
MMLIVDCGSSKTPQIVSAFEEFCDTQCIGFHDLTEDLANESIGIVFSGAPLLITEIDMSKYVEHVSWLKSFQKPILGICFGHQLLGLLYGAKGAKCGRTAIGKRSKSSRNRLYSTDFQIVSK